jgi:tellurite resistance protein
VSRVLLWLLLRALVLVCGLTARSSAACEHQWRPGRSISSMNIAAF